MTAGPIIRTVRPQDLSAEDVAVTADIFFRAVLDGTRDHYDENQRTAWAPALPDAAIWADRLRDQTVVMALYEDEITGFSSLRPDSHVDLCFVVPGQHRKGIGRRLLSAVEKEARAAGHTALTADVSLAAQRLFLICGWTVIRERVVTKRGVGLINYQMKKDLGAG